MVRGRKQVIHVKDVDKAKKALDAIWNDPPANAPSLDQDGDASWGPVVLCEATTWKDFERWLDVNEGRVRRWVFEPLADGSGQGRVVIYSIPSFVHDATTCAIAKSIFQQIQAHGNSILLGDTVEWATNPTCWTGDRGQEPGFGFTPVGLTVGGPVVEAANGCPFPNVIVEVAYKNENLAGLRAKLVRWMAQTSVQVAIGIKIFAGGATPLRRVAILHQRGQPVQEVEFGLDGQRAPPLTISFPVAAVYVGVALPAALAGLNNPQITIDLIALRALIEENIQLDDADRAAAAQVAAQ
ncbi:hypothetical protein PF003_g19435 [Phytophthora fragariae]|nr:hypothetical protein PF003_g19435 [Phytophthora fragariae]